MKITLSIPDAEAAIRKRFPAAEVTISRAADAAPVAVTLTDAEIEAGLGARQIEDTVRALAAAAEHG